LAALADPKTPVASLADVAAAYNRAFTAAEKPPLALKDETPPPGDAAIRALAHSGDFPANLPYEETAKMLKRQIDTKVAPLRRDIEALNWTEPGAPVRAMALVDRAVPRNSQVLLRGNPANKGAEVPRRFLSILSGEAPAPFRDGSGRLELARAIATAENPLTARVWVNRVWGWHFGTALVRTPSDFGVRTEAPELRGLLDWLAAHFVESGWSVKALHRAIVRSKTYRQSGDAPAASAAGDPENRLLTRFQRRRLEFEAMRDTLLVAAGRLERRVGGLAEDLIQPPFSRRRTVYGFIDRQNLPGMFRTFDFPNPDVSSAQRFATTVPQQALFLLNSPFVLEQARALAERVERVRYSADRTRSMVVSRSTRSYGLLTKSSAPSFFDSMAFFRSANPVSMITLASGRFSLMNFSTSKPSTRGILMSSSTRWKVRCSRMEMASSPSAAETTEYPSPCNSLLSTLRSASSSSTTRMLNGCAIGSPG
ncbi:MAG: DUF1553 domain-containing protein, partial [Bacteroidetes bacterium]|nr:DUF1553 domain-containing protein [Bacteroidota bacterium]